MATGPAVSCRRSASTCGASRRYLSTPRRGGLARNSSWTVFVVTRLAACRDRSRVVKYRRDLLGRKIRRHDDLEHLQVVAVRQLAMPDRRRLVDARPRLEPHRAMTFIVEFDP